MLVGIILTCRSLENSMLLERHVVAVTGSTGKTTTREMIASILQLRWKIFKTTGNGNDAWFTSQYANQIDNSHQAIVLEYGMRFSGDIKKSCDLIPPSIGIITNVGSAHIGNFDGNLVALAAAKSELIAGMQNGGVLLLNADDEYSKLLNTTPFLGKSIAVSITAPSDYQAIDISHNQHGIQFKVKLDNTLHEFHIALLGKHNIYNALFGIATAHSLGFSPTEIKTALELFIKPERRLNMLQLPNNTLLIDDTFNASPESMIAAIDVLAEIGVGKKIAVLGSMLDQEGYHEGYKQIGKHLATKKIDLLYTVGCELVGDSAKFIGEAAIKAGIPPQNVQYCPTQRDLLKRLFKDKLTNSTLLVKGTLFYTLIKYIKLTTFLSSDSAFKQPLLKKLFLHKNKGVLNINEKIDL